MALRSEKTRSALAEFGVMANMMRAATAHVGNFWPLRRQKSKMELVNASMLVVSTTTPMQPAAGLVLLGIHRRAVGVLDGV
jgi:hypothetical protein